MQIQWTQAVAAAVMMFAVAGAAAASASAQNAPAPAQGRQNQPQPAPSVSPFDISGSFYKTFSNSSSGNGTAQTTTDSYGGMVGIRYTPGPWKGAEINYSFNHLDQSFAVQPACGLLCSNAPITIPNLQSQVTVEYVASRRMGRVTPFAEAGFAFVINYTTGNAYAINTVVRPGYVGGAGADFGGPRFGVRVQFRDTFYKAPNLTASYLPTGKFMETAEPMGGFYFRF
jgi:hypothetical protein